MNNKGVKEEIEFQKSFYNKCMDGERVQVKRKRKRISVIDFKKLSRTFLIIALSVGITIGGINIVTDKIIRDNKLDSANDYMRTKIVTYLENSGLNYSVLEDKIIFEKDSEKIRDFVELLKKDNFSRDEVIYMVSQVCDEKDFDNITQAYGYDDSQDFLDENYVAGTLSSDGKTLISKWGDMNVFENNVEMDYVESVDELKTKEENKGLNR